MPMAELLIKFNYFAGEISEDMLREDTFSDRQTPVSSR